ncbi:Eco57I restriction-modification methylase domain-containing protein [Methanocella arvoryzae]|nr:N-6 DNA methylase [Methanocella arvoryzae]
MARHRLTSSLTDRYLQLIETMAAESFGGDTAAARALADSALVSGLLIEAGVAGSDDHVDIPATYGRDISGIIRSMADPADDLDILLDSSWKRYRSVSSRDNGVVYTPAGVARFICRKTIGQWLLRQVNRQFGRSYVTQDEMIEACSPDEAWKAREILNRARILDSSCGTGVFLQAAAEEMTRLKATFDPDRHESDIGQIFQHTLENNISGTDIDENALKIARARLMLSLRKAGHLKGKGIRLQIEKRNALLPGPEPPRTEQYDIIVGNPPYMRIKSMYRGETDGLQRKKTLASEIMKSGLYRLQDGNLNLYKLFIERNLSLLKADGSMGLIIPSPFLNEASSAGLRRHIFDTCTVEEIVEIPEKVRAFGVVNQATAILVLHKGEPGTKFNLRLGASAESLEGGSISVDLKELKAITAGRMEVPLLTAPAIEWGMLKHLMNVPPFKGDSHFPEVGSICVGQLDETLDKEFLSETPTGDIFVKGIHLHEYSVDLSEAGSSPRWVDKKAFLEKRPSAARVIESARIIGRNTINKSCKRRLKFALLPPGYVCGNSIKQIVITDPQIRPLYLLGILNSSVLNWYFEVFCSQNNVRNYSIEAMPIPRAPGPAQEAVACVARSIMETEGETREYLDKKLMDALIYELYFMDTRMLSSAVLAAIDERSGPGAFMHEGIQRIVEMIEGREGFKIVRQATYRLK